MGIIHKDLLICVLCNDTANNLDCLMLNVWLMGDELMGRMKYNGYIISFGYKTVSGSIPDGVFAILH